MSFFWMFSFCKNVVFGPPYIDLNFLQTWQKQACGEKFGTSIGNVASERTYYKIPPFQVSQYVVQVKLLEKIKQYFTNPRVVSRQNIVVLLGMGGQGKTQLALEFCRVAKLSRRFQAIFWVDALSPKSILRDFELIIERISNKGRVFDNIKSKIDFVKDTLEGWQFPWLNIV